MDCLDLSLCGRSSVKKYPQTVGKRDSPFLTLFGVGGGGGRQKKGFV